MLIYRTPDAEASGGSGELPPEPKKPEPRVVHSISPEVQSALDRLKDLEAKQAERDRADKAREEAELLKRGEYERIIKDRDAENVKLSEKARDAEERAKRTTRDRELALALGAQNLRPGAAKHLTKLLADDLEAVPNADGGYEVRSKDRRSVADFIADTLKSPEYDSFVASSAAPGAGAVGSRSAPTPAPVEAAVEPKNLGAALLDYWKNRQAAPNANPYSQPRGFGPAK